VTNWAAYDIALRQRGSLTVWFTEAAIAAWKAEPRATRGGQPRYSALAITTALSCGRFSAWRHAQRLVLRIKTREGRQERWMNIQDAIMKCPDEFNPNQRM